MNARGPRTLSAMPPRHEPSDSTGTPPLRIAGIDEAGRGPLAGPVVVAAVVFAPGRVPVNGLDDSKQLDAGRREVLYDRIVQRAVAYRIEFVEVEEIDRINILQASLLAMRRAVEQLTPQPEHVLVDGNKLPRWRYTAEAVIGGDDRVPSIAAASIIAKVTRDREMVQLDAMYPGYGLASHKGYSTLVHLDALTKLERVWKDDDQVVLLIASKRFAAEGEQPATHVMVSPI